MVSLKCTADFVKHIAGISFPFFLLVAWDIFVQWWKLRVMTTGWKSKGEEEERERDRGGGEEDREEGGQWWDEDEETEDEKAEDEEDNDEDAEDEDHPEERCTE